MFLIKSNYTQNDFINELYFLKNLEKRKIKGKIVNIENFGDVWIKFFKLPLKFDSRNKIQPTISYEYKFFLAENFIDKEIALFSNNTENWKRKQNSVKLWFEKDNFMVNKHVFFSWLRQWITLYKENIYKTRKRLQTLLITNYRKRFKFLRYLRLKPKKSVLNKLFFFVFSCNIINTKINMLYNFFYNKIVTFTLYKIQKSNLFNLFILTKFLKTRRILKIRKRNFVKFFTKIFILKKWKKKLFWKNFIKNSRFSFSLYTLPYSNFNNVNSFLIITNNNISAKKIIHYKKLYLFKSLKNLNVKEIPLNKEFEKLNKLKDLAMYKNQKNDLHLLLEYFLKFLKIKFKYFFFYTQN